MATAIEMPTMGGVQRNLMSYGAGVIAGLGYDMIGRFTGSGLIAGALSAAIAGSLVKGPMGEVISISAGFNQGSKGMAALGMGNLLPGFLGGPGNGNGRQTNGPSNAILTI
jgi:hypothetical protein